MAHLAQRNVELCPLPAWRHAGAGALVLVSLLMRRPFALR
mgnify:CR=1 FL=1